MARINVLTDKAAQREQFMSWSYRIKGEEAIKTRSSNIRAYISSYRQRRYQDTNPESDSTAPALSVPIPGISHRSNEIMEHHRLSARDQTLPLSALVSLSLLRANNGLYPSLGFLRMK